MADVWFAATSLQTLMQQAGKLVDLSGDAQANVQDVRLTDVLAVSDQFMAIKAGANDVVNLDASGWSHTEAAATLDNHSYDLWSNGRAHVLIDHNAQVHQVL